MVEIKNLSPNEIDKAHASGNAVLIDVREADEWAAGHIAGALFFPLSVFDPTKLPNTDGKSMIFYCAGGVRSARAVALCADAGLAHDAHLQGGIKAWITAGLPVER